MSSNNLLFISVFNKGSLELAKNHVTSLTHNGVQNYMCYVTDQESLEELEKDNIQCILLKKDGKTLTDKMDFGTEDFNDLSYLRYYVIHDLLMAGKDVWYLDTDTVALADLNYIYRIVKADPEPKDIYFQNDINSACTGCALYLNTPKTINVVKSVIQNKTTKANDQIVMHNLIKQFSPEHFSFGLFSARLFPCGLLFFDEPWVTKDPIYKSAMDTYAAESDKPVVFVHANWMIGNEKKIEALKAYGLWNKK